jgi:small subunit ribosomal protein S9
MTEKNEKYIEAVGRRKTSVARVRIVPASKTSFKINEKTFDEYFPTLELRKVVEEAITASKETFKVSAHVKGGGIHSQAEAVRHGIARALVKNDDKTKTVLKTSGFLKRDPRAKERRKFGLKKARKAPQWSKR